MMYSEKPLTEEHETKVCRLTVGDLLQMSNENLISSEDVDRIYYYLLDSKKIREFLANSGGKNNA